MISERVQVELLMATTMDAQPSPGDDELDELVKYNKGKQWTNEEHERFLHALERHPNGPWKVIAAYVGTKTTRQTMTHGQKYREKLQRRQHPKRVRKESMEWHGTVKAGPKLEQRRRGHSVGSTCRVTPSIDGQTQYCITKTDDPATATSVEDSHVDKPVKPSEVTDEWKALMTAGGVVLDATTQELLDDNVLLTGTTFLPSDVFDFEASYPWEPLHSADVARFHQPALCMGSSTFT